MNVSSLFLVPRQRLHSSKASRRGSFPRTDPDTMAPQMNAFLVVQNGKRRVRVRNPGFNENERASRRNPYWAQWMPRGYARLYVVPQTVMDMQREHMREGAHPGLRNGARVTVQGLESSPQGPDTLRYSSERAVSWSPATAALCPRDTEHLDKKFKGNCPEELFGQLKQACEQVLAQPQARLVGQGLFLDNWLEQLAEGSPPELEQCGRIPEGEPLEHDIPTWVPEEEAERWIRCATSPFRGVDPNDIRNLHIIFADVNEGTWNQRHEPHLACAQPNFYE